MSSVVIGIEGLDGLINGSFQQGKVHLISGEAGTAGIVIRETV